MVCEEILEEFVLDLYSVDDLVGQRKQGCTFHFGTNVDAGWQVVFTDHRHDSSAVAVSGFPLNADSEASNALESLAKIPPILPSSRQIHGFQKLCRCFPTDEAGAGLHRSVHEEVQQRPITSVRHGSLQCCAERHGYRAAVRQPRFACEMSGGRWLIWKPAKDKRL